MEKSRQGEAKARANDVCNLQRVGAAASANGGGCTRSGGSHGFGDAEGVGDSRGGMMTAEMPVLDRITALYSQLPVPTTATRSRFISEIRFASSQHDL